ncbi:glycosyltransferase family 2 protein [Pontimicrobium aquaticum]|uniref:Glycosyltransferase family 2 protein n=1 Tax=Pontimicrobium aquaticum TaxID=2565367 RepID=A0A4U0EP85_9FLAO|nr:glycosyltransferase family 2 protein [Pontimicrobium aquaticum]TJY32894.1 glycosyltransferase family 2 protein [Pontimicrobium aquaticum]
MLFSILVANYNNGHFFKDCYNSIIQQTLNNWEVIIVDDASTDNSIDVIKELINDDKRFKFYQNKKNKGCGFTKRRCAELANGELLGFLDPDDALKPNALEVMVLAHNKFKNASIITSRYEIVDLQLNFLKEGVVGSKIPSGKSYLTFGKGALTAFATFKNEAYKKTNGIDPLMKRAIDQDLYYKLEEQGEHIFTDMILYLYRIHENSISCNDNLYKANYWHFYAINKAYKRRKKLKLEIDNFSKKYMSKYRSNYYLSRFEKLKFSKKHQAKFYFLGKAFFSNPSHKFILKFKSFLLLIIGRI